jgi:hypothetical protein
MINKAYIFRTLRGIKGNKLLNTPHSVIHVILRMRHEEKLTMILLLTFCFIIQTVYSLTVNDCMECVSNNKAFFKNLYPYSWTWIHLLTQKWIFSTWLSPTTTSMQNRWLSRRTTWAKTCPEYYVTNLLNNWWIYVMIFAISYILPWF